MNVDSAKSQLAHAQDHIEDVLFVINIEKPLKPKDEEFRAQSSELHLCVCF